ncbi:MAG: DegT/DnrJ/EryC1/StrS family aminotransferase [Lentisphaeria bacterium]|nr:DegT/DnrJ/EryC1/StrS family aminotransferase [Lentisphaeria bacterium]
MILQADPGRSFAARKAEIRAAVERVLDSGWYILGNENRFFEEKFAAYNDSPYCIGVANGTDAVEIILRALDIGPGDLVATVGNTAVATVSAIERTGAGVRFADIESGRFTMSPDSLKSLLDAEKNIKAVVVVHLFGAPADMEKIINVADEYKIPVIEDCAQAHGAMYHGRKCGSIGIAGSFSFYPTKNLGALGDGGAVITSNRDLYEKMAALRQYGWVKRYISEFSGINSRLDEMQAAILSVKLPFLDEANAGRRAIAAKYREAFCHIPGIILPEEPDNCQHVYHQFVIRVQNGKRDELAVFLKNSGIGTAVHYPEPIPCQKAYQHVPATVALNHTLTVNDEILSLPMYPELSGCEVERIISAVRGFFA